MPLDYNSGYDTTIKWPFNYLNGLVGGESEYVSGEGLNTALVLDNFAQFSVVNSGYLSYLASTAHTRQYQYQAAGWANSKSQASAQLAYTQSQMQVANSQANAQLGYNQSMLANRVGYGMSLINTGASTAGGVIGSAVSGNLGGVVSSLAQGALGAANATANSYVGAQAAQTALTQNQNTTAMQSRMATQNQQLANFVNQGDYQNAIAGIQATVQDAAITQPSQSGQIGGDGFNWAKGYHNIIVNFKRISGAAFASVAQYFERYGYAIRRRCNFGEITLDKMQVMEHFSYWKCPYLYITEFDGTETERDAFRGIFAKGVTIWSDPADIGHQDVGGRGNLVSANARLSY